MFLKRVPITGDARVWIDLDDVRPELLARGVEPGQGRNRGWNQRVLTLLQDAGLIALDTPSDAVPPDHMSSPVGTRLLRTDMLEDEWDVAWQHARQRGWLDSTADFHAMQAILLGQRCVAAEFSARFELPLADVSVVPAPACNGCPWCRSHSQDPYADHAQVAASGRTPLRDSEPTLARLLRVAPERVIAVVAQTRQRGSVIEAALKNLERGVFIAAELDALERRRITERRTGRPGIADEAGNSRWAPVPGSVELIVASDRLPEWTLEVEGAALRVLVVTPETASPLDPHRTVAEMRPVPVFYAEQFISLIS
jgi:hypothetical protein